MQKGLFRSYRARGGGIFLLCLVIVSLVSYLPILKSPYGADDIWMSTLPQRYQFGTETPIGHLVSQIEFWEQRGRLMWSGLVIETFIFEIFNTRESYKIYQVFLNVLVSISVYFALSKSGVRRNYALLAFVTFLALGQIRPFFDPRIHFAGLQQLVGLSTIWITFLALRYRNTRKSKHLYTAAIILFLCAMLYETIMLLFPIWVFVIVFDPAKRKLYLDKPNLVFVSTGVAFISMALFARKQASDIVPGYSIDLTFASVLKTYLIQLEGTIPTMSYNGIAANFSLNDSLKVSPTLIASLTLGLLALLAYVLSKKSDSEFFTSSQTKQSHFVVGTWTAIGISLLVLPPVLISITVRWQHELFPGLPYISVYIQQIGLSILIATFVSMALDRFSISKKFFTIPILIPLMVLSLLVTTSNVNLLSGSNEFKNSNMVGVKSFGWDREILRIAISSDSWNHLSGQNRVWFYPQMAWTTTEVISAYSDQQVLVPNSPQWWTNGALPPPEGCSLSPCQLLPDDRIIVSSGSSYTSGIVASFNQADALLMEDQFKAFRYLTDAANVVLLSDSEIAIESLTICSYEDSSFVRHNLLKYAFLKQVSELNSFAFVLNSEKLFDPLTISMNPEAKCSI